MLTIYTSYEVFLLKELSFWGRDDRICVEIFSGVIF